MLIGFIVFVVIVVLLILCFFWKKIKPTIIDEVDQG
jgi:uncharacterized protein involved in outer membrane biogenesis